VFVPLPFLFFIFSFDLFSLTGTPEVVFFGGTTADLDADPSTMSATFPASKQVVRMKLDAAGIRKGWEVDQLPRTGLTMSDAIITPDGKIVILNGAAQGIAGYGNVRDEIGASNARSPNKQPLLYSPDAGASAFLPPGSFPH
jgi:hypothetical protein